MHNFLKSLILLEISTPELAHGVSFERMFFQNNYKVCSMTNCIVWHCWSTGLPAFLSTRSIRWLLPTMTGFLPLSVSKCLSTLDISFYCASHAQVFFKFPNSWSLFKGEGLSDQLWTLWAIIAIVLDKRWRAFSMPVNLLASLLPMAFSLFLSWEFKLLDT